MHANTNPVEFDFSMGSALAFSFECCRKTIESQISEREQAITHAMRDFKGNYADLFCKNTVQSMNYAKELIEALRNAEVNMRKYIEAAKEEVRIREEIKLWEESKSSTNQNGIVGGAPGLVYRRKLLKPNPEILSLLITKFMFPHQPKTPRLLVIQMLHQLFHSFRAIL